jgi:hypothetical protein
MLRDTFCRSDLLIVHGDCFVGESTAFVGAPYSTVNAQAEQGLV